MEGQRPDISIHALHEESDSSSIRIIVIILDISIHALHEESDEVRGDAGHHADISIHALHEESDSDTRVRPADWSTFQSTLSMRRATGMVRF